MPSTIPLNAIPLQLRVVWTEQGALQGADAILKLPGTTAPIGPVGLADVADNPTLQQFLGAANADAIAQKELLEQQVAQLQAEKQALAQERDTAIAQGQQVSDQKDAQIAVLQNDKTDLQSQIGILEQQLHDIQNPPQPSADWPKFRTAIASSAAYRRIASADLLTNQLLVSALWGGAFGDIPALWNAIAQAALPTAGEIAELNALAVDSQLPFELDPDGLMVLVG